jgi:formamidopyrimidine-DNA glycosylase
MPELPEVEITARRLNEALAGARIASATAPGVNTLKTFDPPLSELEGARIEGVSRRGKHLIVRTDNGLALLIHLMSAGRLQLYGERADADGGGGGGNGSSPRARPTARRRATPGRDRTLRLLVRLEDGRELRLREFGSKQATWVKVLRSEELDADPGLAGLGPEAWPDPPRLQELLAEPRPLHAVLRDQHVITGIGRSWVDEILWEARLSPYKRGSELDEEEAARLRAAIVQTLGAALDHYEQVIKLPIPDKLPMPLRVHRHEGEPCRRCATPLASVHFEDYVIAYCPMCQTGGKVLKDRRLSRLLR